MPVSIREFEALARDRLPRDVYDFIAGGADDEVTVRANEDAFARLRLVPRVLRGCGKPDLGTTLFGAEVTLPVVLSPTAFHRLVDPEGERATARAAAKAGTVMITGMASTVSVGDIAKECGRDLALWFQLYAQSDERITRELVGRAEDAGCRALVVTVDSPVFGRRERDHRNGFHDLPAGVRCENMRDLGGRPGVRDIEMVADLSWDHIDHLVATTGLPVVLKGLVHPADAVAAVAHGISGVMVSNHGGRQLDTVVATIDALADVAAAVDIPVLADGGIRRGTDVLKALALGADAVGIGRPVLWGLAARGEAGVGEVLELLRDEIDRAMALSGCASVQQVTSDLVSCEARFGGFSTAQVPAGRTAERPKYNPVRGPSGRTPSGNLEPPITPPTLPDTTPVREPRC
ncbi:alpha-hydroxy-acid oxidizing enzyme [Actinosynnema sp. ALI-1.44]|uniref:alpha-hydroxy acid oxidase n=1 Tax=Actinosynnema sp. ALI-1.44 TaxID=1933779 RepID=UPI00097C45AD|nr:alpha-hydroxy acid oxidase [Actinosynnema sp. ALI-1.44]ONI74953.1 alpha-hydroxy-acid oxidizing enzyme [Actinosynnema sp. ALI-1.44]